MVHPITPPPPPPAPPITPGPIVPTAPPTWPQVLGVIAIVLGSLGTLAGSWGIIGTLIVPGALSATPEMAAWQGRWQWWMLLSNLMTLALGLLVLLSGIGLVRRRRWGARAIVAWACLRAVWTIVEAAIMVPMVGEQMRAVAPAAVGGPPVAVETIAVAASVAFTLIWGLAPAAFVLIWFTRQTIRRHIADWS